MADHYHRSLEVLNGIDQGVDRFHVQVIGWLVEVDQMRLFVGDNGQSDTAFLSTRERLDLSQGHVSAHAKAAEDASRLLVGEARKGGLHTVHAGGLEVQGIHMVLREGTYSCIPVDVNLASCRNQALLHDFQQRALPSPIGSQDADAAFDVQVGRGVLEEWRLARIGKSQTIKLDQLALGKRPRIWEVDRQGGGVIEGDGWILDLLHLVEHLLLARLLRHDLGPLVVLVDELQDV
mmetsp:Transcript_128579/g.305139  ORF Transcript_128579/g.305139 Transcript_128579/m.305139 type:complete len:235 (-) Transcript_128579:1512-2216(-)